MATLTADASIATYQDAIDYLVDYANQNAAAGAMRPLRRAILDAYDDIVNARSWKYLSRHYRIELSTPATGTCSYDSATGVFTIDSDSWPEWAELSMIEIGDVRSLVKTRTSDTALLADDTIRPIDDIDTGAEFTLYRCVYPLPFDFRRMHRPLDEYQDTFLDYVDLSEWLRLGRYQLYTGAMPRSFAVSGHPYQPGRFVLLLQPTGDYDRTCDFTYQRYPRPLNYTGKEAPSNSGTIQALGTTIAGITTAFEEGMVGAILRYGRTASQYPDGRGGNNPFFQQVFIASYTSASELSSHETITNSDIENNPYKYTISDPLDLDRGMLDAFWRMCEFKLSQKLKLAGVDRAERDAMIALQKAKSSDSKSSSPRTAWGRGFIDPRLRGRYDSTIQD
jgi:hypothetical protein